MCRGGKSLVFVVLSLDEKLGFRVPPPFLNFLSVFSVELDELLWIRVDEA